MGYGIEHVRFAGIGGGVNGSGRRAIKTAWVVTRDLGYRKQIIRKFETKEAAEKWVSAN